MASAIWSSGPGQTDLFPARALLEFMNNHGLLGVFGHLQWRTVSGGSIQYVKAITREFSDRIHVACPVRKIERKEGGVVLHFDDIEAKHYDHVVIAAHADQALAMLENPSSAETELLQPWNYSQNATVLHTDTACMPAHRAAWASWNYHLQNCRQIDAAVNLDYWMNQLQTIESPPDIIVSLNPVHPPAPEKILNSFLYEHPVYTRESMATQSRLPSLNGLNNTYFCGAYHRWGFHEDGLVSAIRVAEQLGVSFP
jgi:predicted NAD/FAD-binding protein